MVYPLLSSLPASTQSTGLDWVYHRPTPTPLAHVYIWRYWCNLVSYCFSNAATLSLLSYLKSQQYDFYLHLYLPSSPLEWHVEKWVKWNTSTPPPMKIAPFLMLMVADMAPLLALGLVAYFITLLEFGFFAS